MTANSPNVTKSEKQPIRCAIYTRKSTDEGLDREFNSLDAQRESAEAYIASQQHERWACLPDPYDDGGYTGGNMDRPALQRLLEDIEAGKIDCIVVYKVDRLSRSLLDFSRLVELFDEHGVSFVSVTQQFNTTHSMGRLTLNILLSFAQFEREIISERTRDKMAATRRKGKWSGGHPILGYDVVERKLVINEAEAARVRQIFELYVENQSLVSTIQELNRRGWTTKLWTIKKGGQSGGRPFDKGNLHGLLTNVLYIGQVRYKEEVHPGEHQGLVDPVLFERVQALLHENARTEGAATRGRFTALLTGLLRCVPCACSMPHTHTVKRNTRYRYYVCLHAQKQGWSACPSQSVPAAEIERFVIDQIRRYGRDTALPAEATFDPDWDSLSLCDQARLLRLLVERVDYDGRSGDISITFHPAGIKALTEELADQQKPAK
jgi:site-specific DNA recombinase